VTTAAGASSNRAQQSSRLRGSTRNESGVSFRATDVRSIMTARVVTVEMDDRLDVVKQAFDTLKFHHLLKAITCSRH
jgi:hypothetical protein